MINHKRKRERLIEWLSKGFVINSYLAFKIFGITSLHSMLTKLRNSGFPVDMGEWNDPNERDFKRYKLIFPDNR